MPDTYLHIVSFDIPDPPNYGGVIDVFYKIKALHNMGVKIILHAFEYPGRDRSEKLRLYCHRVNYYPRILGIRSAISRKPYIVLSRRSDELIKNLQKDSHPILFEGLHSCYYLNHPALSSRFKIYRESNIEHQYYFNLFKVDRSFLKRFYYLIASIKLMAFQKILHHADLMLAVSREDTNYLRQHFPDNHVEYLPSFHANNDVESVPGTGGYALYNGNIEVPENTHAVEYLIREVFNDVKLPFKVAGMNPPEHIIKLAAQYKNVEIIANPADDVMFDLIKNAHINILVTFQATGLKLKLLNTLYKGRFCLVNEKMLNGTGLENLCEVANSAAEFKRKLKILQNRNFEKEQITLRRNILNENYSNKKNAISLKKILIDQSLHSKSQFS